MFAPITNLPVKINEEKFLIQLGYDLPNNVKIEDIKEAPKFCYSILKEVEEGKFESVPEPVEGEARTELWMQLNSTAQVFTKGFIEGAQYYKAVLEFQSEASSNDNKSSIITEK